MPVHFRLFLISLLMLPSVSGAYTLRALEHKFAAASDMACPRVLTCVSGKCVDPERTDDAAAKIDRPLSYYKAMGINIPSAFDAQTNFPILNAGLQMLRRTGDRAYLDWAVSQVCSSDPIDTKACAGPMIGIPPNTEPPPRNAYYPLWSLNISTEAQRDSCRRYLARVRSSEFSLRPKVALQSSPYSDDGIMIRTQLGRIADAAPAFLLRCRKSEESSAMLSACRKITAFIDDLKFGLVLADKNSGDGHFASSLRLLKSCERGAKELEALASEVVDLDDDVVLARSIEALCARELPNLRAAIQQGISQK